VVGGRGTCECGKATELFEQIVSAQVESNGGKQFGESEKAAKRE